MTAALLQGNKQENQRDVYVDPTKDVAEILGLTPEQMMALEGSVYGLRNWSVTAVDIPVDTKPKDLRLVENNGDIGLLGYLFQDPERRTGGCPQQAYSREAKAAPRCQNRRA